MLAPLQSLSELQGWGGETHDFETSERSFGPVDIDPGPYCCYVEPCLRLSGFMTQEALDRHIRLFH